jgi:protein-disulfide isomerase
MIRYYLLLAALAAMLAPGCTQSPEQKRGEIEQVLKDNPEIVLNVLRENQEEVYAIAEAGLRQRQRKAERVAWRKRLQNPLEPEIAPDRPVRGDPDAPVTVVEYSDFQCPYCPRGARTMELLLGMRPDKVKLHFKHMPLPSHPMALTAARYFEAAAMQDMDTCWLLHDAMFENQEELKEGGEEWIKAKAAELGLDPVQLEKDSQSDEVSERITSDLREAEEFGLRGTPTFIVGGVLVAGAKPLEDLDYLVDLILKHRQSVVDQEPGAQAAEGQGQPALPLQQGQPPVCEDCGEEEEGAQ